MSLIGGLSYLAIFTRPDISFAMSVLARHLHSPTNRHMVLSTRVVRYTFGPMDRKTFFPLWSINSCPLTAYADGDWAGCNATRRSTTGIFITLNSEPVSWTLKCQTMMALSSAEAEYIALSTCCREASHLRRLFQ